MKKQMLLLGAGHAHLYTIKRLREFVDAGFDCTVVAPDCFWYSGLATGVLAGHYPAELDQVDVAPLVAKQGGTFVEDYVEKIVPEQKEVHLRSGKTLAYDVVSLNLGSQVPVEKIPGANEFGTPVKPIGELLELPNRIQQWTQKHPNQPLRVVVIGGGPTGCELGANLRQYLQSISCDGEITLLTSGSTLIPNFSKNAAKKTATILQQRKVHIRYGTKVQEVKQDCVLTESAGSFPYDFLLHAFGLQPSPIPSASGLSCADDGSMIVTEQLHSVDDPTIFGGGDGITLRDQPLAKVGVYAIREAPILYHNLLATLRDKPLKTFQPQQRFLLILNLADGKALATWGPWHWYGRIAFWWKDWLDRKFLKQYQNQT